jgi:hypothetical protein
MELTSSNTTHMLSYAEAIFKQVARAQTAAWTWLSLTITFLTMTPELVPSNIRSRFPKNDRYRKSSIFLSLHYRPFDDFEPPAHPPVNPLPVFPFSITPYLVPQFPSFFLEEASQLSSGPFVVNLANVLLNVFFVDC